MVTVVNVGGSSEHERSTENLTWEQHWKRYSSENWPAKCVCCGANPAEVGGHVRIFGERKQYIVPMCKQCNGKPAGHEFPNVDRKWLVPVVDN